MNICQIDIGTPPPQEGGYNANNGWLHSAISHSKYDCISENSVSFWCNLNEYGIYLRIAKMSPEGKRIEKGIEDNISPSKMEHLLLTLVIPHIKSYQLVKIFGKIRNEAFIRGKNEVRRSLATVLEIES